MDSILIILKKKKWPKGFICPYTGTIFYIIRIYSRSQVSIYRTIGPLVLLFDVHAQTLCIIFRAAGCGKTFQPEELSTKLLGV